MINPIDMATRRRGIILLLALVGLLAAQQAKEVAAQQQEEVSIIVIIQTCLDLDTAIQEAATTTTTTTLGTTPVVSFDLADSITCDGHITISSGQNITIRNSGTTGDITTTITIAADFVANSSSQSLLHVQEGGTLTLDGINFDQQAGGLLPAEGVRAVYNRGTLTVNNCAFNGLNSVAVELLSQGGAVSLESGNCCCFCCWRTKKYSAAAAAAGAALFRHDIIRRAVCVYSSFFYEHMCVHLYCSLRVGTRLKHPCVAGCSHSSPFVSFTRAAAHG